MVSCIHPPGRIGGKDTVIDIKQTKGFVVNIISEPWINQANTASIDAPSDVSEWPITGLTKEPSVSALLHERTAASCHHVDPRETPSC
jgi:hypothetical protein